MKVLLLRVLDDIPYRFHKGVWIYSSKNYYTIIENNVVVQPGSVVVEDQLLKKGKRYAGNPAIEIKGE